MPAYFINTTSRSTRSGEVPDADFLGGMNNGGSCAAGVGIAIGVPDLDGSAESWTLLDQFGADRTPQNSQHLGGDGLGDGVESGASAIFVGTNSNTGNGTVTTTGEATLADLATGWLAV